MLLEDLANVWESYWLIGFRQSAHSAISPGFPGTQLLLPNLKNWCKRDNWDQDPPLACGRLKWLALSTDHVALHEPCLVHLSLHWCCCCLRLVWRRWMSSCGGNPHCISDSTCPNLLLLGIPLVAQVCAIVGVFQLYCSHYRVLNISGLCSFFVVETTCFTQKEPSLAYLKLWLVAQIIHLVCSL